MFILSQAKQILSVARSLARAVTSPPERYHHAQLLHSIRVGLAFLSANLITVGLDLPHGIWASVSLLTVIAGLQHQGNIRKKAGERALGTLLGAGVGLLMVYQSSIFGSVHLTYALMAVTAGICAYYAVGKGGYLALLTAITMCIVSGDANDSIEIGLWRTANVLIGIAIALVFSFALPLYATYSWRYCLAKNLRRCAATYKRIMTGLPMTPEEQIALFAELSDRLATLRGLMPSVAKETGLPLARLKQIQRQHRAILSALEMMASLSLTGAHLNLSPFASAADQHAAGQMPRCLLQMARALRSGHPLFPSVVPEAATDGQLEETGGVIDGPRWLLQQMIEQTERLRLILMELQATRLFSL
jgi:uncharacterized membrane protein YccC